MKPAVKRMLGVFAGFTMLILSFYVFSSMILPTYAEIQEEKANREGLQKMLEEHTAAADNVRSIIANYGDLEETSEKLSRLLPTGEDISGVINQLQGAAALSGVSMNSISSKVVPLDAAMLNTGAINPMAGIRLTVEIVADYASFKEYLGYVETNGRLMDVMDIEVQGGAISQGPYVFGLTVDTYFQQ